MLIVRRRHANSSAPDLARRPVSRNSAGKRLLDRGRNECRRGPRSRRRHVRRRQIDWLISVGIGLAAMGLTLAAGSAAVFVRSTR